MNSFHVEWLPLARLWAPRLFLLYLHYHTAVLFCDTLGQYIPQLSRHAFLMPYAIPEPSTRLLQNILLPLFLSQLNATDLSMDLGILWVKTPKRDAMPRQAEHMTGLMPDAYKLTATL